MGCDISSCIEYYDKESMKWIMIQDIPSLYDGISPFLYRNYQLFAFLGYDGRTYFDIPKCDSCELDIVEDNISEGAWCRFYHWKRFAHNVRCVTLEELNNFNYDQEIRRENSDKKFNLRELLEEDYFDSLKIMNELDKPKIRVVYWFDS